MKRLAWGVFIISEVGMLWVAFAWPLVVDADPSSETLRIVALAVLFGFLGSLFVLLAARVRSLRDRG